MKEMTAAMVMMVTAAEMEETAAEMRVSRPLLNANLRIPLIVYQTL
jgi:hypothetical protein